MKDAERLVRRPALRGVVTRPNVTSVPRPMRILIVDTCYPAFLDAHYVGRPELTELGYEGQWRALMDTCFGTFDAYSHHLRPLGHEAHEVVANCAPLQRAWAEEQGIEGDEEDVLLAQVQEFEPDVVYVQDLHHPSDEALSGFRRHARLVVGQIASALPGAGRLRSFDLLLTSFPHFVERFRSLGVDSEYFRIGFDPRVAERLGRDGPAQPQYGVVFVGALNRTQHRRANGLLARAARRMPIDFWGYGLRGWPPWSPVRRRHHGEAWGLDMYRVLRDSRIALNRHIGIAGEYANNMRLFEATGVGSMLLTDEKSNLGELFEPGREVVTYRTADELAERARHYLAHEEERQAIAAAGQERTLRDHGYDRRMVELAALLEARL
jgi:spore maturation protein CgeB